MGLQPSASKTTLLLKCPYPFGDEVEIPRGEEVAEAPRYGSAFHSLMEEAPLGVGEKLPPSFPAAVDRVGTDWDLSPSIRAELAEHVRSSLPVLQKWLGGKNKFDRKFNVRRLKREKSYAVRPAVQRRVRPIAGPTKDGHLYEIEDGEIAMTADLESPQFVMDHKTGSRDDNFARPDKNNQLRTLSLADAPNDETIVAIFHADRRGLPVIYAEELRPAVKDKHAKRLHRALRRIGSGYLRPGSHCGFCPVRSICPTQTAELLAGAASLIEGGTATLAVAAKNNALSTPEGIGNLHLFFSEFDRIKERVKPLMKMRVKEYLALNTEVWRRDGKKLTVRSHMEERLSKKAIVDALGIKEAERLFAKLRKAGALEAHEVEGLFAVLPD